MAKIINKLCNSIQRGNGFGMNAYKGLVWEPLKVWLGPGRLCITSIINGLGLQEGEVLGVLLYRSQQLTREQLAESLEMMEERNMRQGEALIEMGKKVLGM